VAVIVQKETVAVIVQKESWSSHISSPLLRCGKFCISFDDIDILESKYLLDFGRGNADHNLLSLADKIVPGV
jgi:hypothetical protein